MAKPNCAYLLELRQRRVRHRAIDDDPRLAALRRARMAASFWDIAAMNESLIQ